MRSHKNAIFNSYTMIDGYIVLNFDITTQPNLGIDENTSTQDTVLTNYCSFSNLALMPDTGPFTNTCRRSDISAGMNSN
jgi:hypothetical protein